VYDVYIQWFDSTGARIRGNERVNDNLAPGAAYSPSCAFAPDGKLAVEFNDERDFPGNPQIYCQRFGPDGARISFNKMVNEPKLFPNNSHWTVGQSIAASDDVLAFAWTDNRRHKGFDIYAKLTDWNLIGVDEKTGDRGQAAGVAGRPSVVRRNGRLAIGLHSSGPDACLYDATGRQVLRASVAGRSGFDLTGISPGTYFVVARNGAAFDCRKVVIE
jgi:hypothetical protein